MSHGYSYYRYGAGTAIDKYVDSLRHAQCTGISAPVGWLHSCPECLNGSLVVSDWFLFIMGFVTCVAFHWSVMHPIKLTQVFFNTM